MSLSEELETLIEKHKERPTPKPIKGIRGRPGVFEITQEFLESEDAVEAALEVIMSRVFIVSCEHDYTRQVFRYMGYSNVFDQITEGECAPYYTFKFKRIPATVHGDKDEVIFDGVERRDQ